MLFASAATLLFALMGWLFVYGICYWFTVAFLSVKDGLNFHGTEHFNRNFFSSIAVLYVATLLDRWIFRFKSDVEDRRPFSETLLDIALFLPRMTLAVVENFAVWISLSKSQMLGAVRLVECIRERGRYPLHELPLLIGDDRDREAALMALRTAQVVDVRSTEGVAWIYIGGLAPAELGCELLARNGDNKAAGVRSAPMFKNKNALPGAKRQLPGRNRDDL